MLEGQQRRGLLDYIKLVVPSNPTTAIAVFVPLLALVIKTAMTWHKEPTMLNSALFALYIVCLVITGIMNYADQSKQEEQLSRDVAALTRW